MHHPFALITDSTIDENAAYFTAHDIRVVPRSCNMDNRTIEEDCGQTPVSYTHLDVYKRQIQARSG